MRNIANEPKREPLKLARIVKIHDSRDDTQRVVTLTYHNVKQNKDGEWIGKPVKVDRSINDLVLVDNALNESMLNPNILKGDDEIQQGKDMDNDENNENDENDENDEPQDRLDDNLREVREQSNNNNTEANDDEGDVSEDKGDELEDKTDEPKDDNNAANEDKGENNGNQDQDENVQNVRKSNRKHMQRIEIKPEEIGECDYENDKDYK